MSETDTNDEDTDEEIEEADLDDFDNEGMWEGEDD